MGIPSIGNLGKYIEGIDLKSAVIQGADLYFVFTFIKRLVTPFNKTAAFKLKIIDKDGKPLKKRKDLTKN